MSNQIGVGIGCLVWKDGKFLLQQRRNAHGDGTWAPPGGHLEFGESWEECAAREIFEETGMKVKNIRLIAVTNDIFTSENKHYVTILMESDWASGKPAIQEPGKCMRQEWFTYQTMPEPLFLPWIHLRQLKPELFV